MEVQIIMNSAEVGDSVIVNKQLISGILPVRSKNSSKGDFGRVLLVTGSSGMTGSGCLAAISAFRTGAGLVYIASPASLSDIYACNIMEAINIKLEDDKKGILSKRCIPELDSAMRGKSVIAVGPGLTTLFGVENAVEHILKNSNVPLVIDADALNIIAKQISLLSEIKAGAVITPHPGEMSRLTGKSIESIMANRIETAREFAIKWKVTVVLKGAGTVTAVPGGDAYINSTGNPGMATAGSGDVLTGVIASLIGQGIQMEKAAVTGVFLHGLAGDFAQAGFGEYGMMASDIAANLPAAIKSIL